MSVVQQLPPHTCPYANKAGLVLMTLGQSGKVQAKTGAVLYEVHLAQENGKFKKLGKAMTLNEAATASAENEKALGWDKLPALVNTPRGVDPAVMKAKSKRAKSSEKIEAGETIISSVPETAAELAVVETVVPVEAPAVVVPDPVIETVAAPVPPAVARPEGAKPERAQPKASERQPKKVAEKKPDPIVAAARAANRRRFD